MDDAAPADGIAPLPPAGTPVPAIALFTDLTIVPPTSPGILIPVA
jgi:hypothetical protein